MSWLSSLHEESRSWAQVPWPKDPALAHLWGTGRRTEAGITVTDELAMMCSAIFAAVNILSSDIAKAPLNLLKRLENGGSEHVTWSKTYHLMKTEANPETGSMIFRQTLQAHALTLGGGYAEIVRDGLGRPAAIWQITPDRICAKRSPGKRLYYLVDQKDEFEPEDILHIHGLGYNGSSGYALLNQARQAVGLALAMEKFSAAFFGHGATPGGILSVDAPLTDPEEKKLIREELEKTNSGVDRAFRWLVMGNGMKAEPFQMDNQKSDLNPLRDKQIEEVSRFYRMPLHKLNNLLRATFSNVEQQDLEYYKGPVLDWFTLWEQECHRKLIPKLERQLFFFKHNANVFLRGDMAARSAAFGIFRDKGILNADEIRDLEDMGPQPDGQGKLYLVQTAQMPQGKLAELADAQIAKVKAETEKIQRPEPAPTPQTNGGPDGEPMRSVLAKLDAAKKLAEEWRQNAESAARDAAEATGAKASADTEVELRRQAETAAVEKLESTLQRLAQADVLTAEQRGQIAAAQADTASAITVREAVEARQARLSGELTGAVFSLDQYRAGAEAAEVALAGLRTERDALQASTDELRTQLSARDAAIAHAETEARTATEAREALEAQMATVRTELAETRETAAALTLELTDARSQRAALDEARQSLETQLTDAERRAAEADARIVSAQSESADALSVATREASEARASVEDLRTKLDAEAETRNSVAEALTDAERRAAEAQQQIVTLAAQVAESTTRFTEAQTRERAAVDELATATRSKHVQATEQQAREMEAHRSLYLHVMRGAIERETDRARRAQQSPEKLRQWIESWYDGHAELMRAALLPASMIHLAWIGSIEDAGDFVRELVADHVATSRRQLAAVVQGDASALAGSLASLLQRWETERITSIPAKLMEREVAYVRSRE